MKQKPHPKAVWLFFFWHARIFGGFVPFLILWIIYLYILRESFPFIDNLGIGKISAIIIGLVILNYIWARLFYNSYFFELTEDAIKIEQGVIWKKYISIPYGRIQNVDIYRGVIARLLGLSNIHIQTAGYSGYIRTEGRLPGLSREEAEKIREDSIQKAKGIKQGL